MATDPYKQLYQEILGQDPDAEGLAYWKQQFGDEISPEEKTQFKNTALNLIGQQAFGRQLSDAEKADLFKLGSAQEARDWANTQGQNWLKNERYKQLYQDILGRDPDTEGLSYWQQQFGDEISPEEKTLFKNTAYNKLISDAYKNLGRTTPDQAGINYWLEQLQSGAIKPQDFASKFSSAAEQAYGPLKNQVLNLYSANKGATATPDEDAIRYWSNQILDKGFDAAKADFDKTVTQIRKDDPTLAAEIDEERRNTGVGVDISGESGLREAYAPYFERMLERGSALADLPFEKYDDKSLTDTGNLLYKARSGLGSLATPEQFAKAKTALENVGTGLTNLMGQSFANPNYRGAVSPDAIKQAGIGGLYDVGGPNASMVRNWYSQNPLAMKANPQGPDQSALDYWVGQIGKKGYSPTFQDFTNTVNLNTAKDLYAQNPLAMRANPQGPDQSALNYWANQLGQKGYDPTYQDFTNTVNALSAGKAEGGEVINYDVGGTVNANANTVTNATPTTGATVPYGGQNITPTQASYMSPYMQNVVDVQQREAKRQSDILGQQEAAKAVGAGAYGGSRAGLVEAERQRNLLNQLGGIQATGLQSAFTQGLGQFNTERSLNLQAQQQAANAAQILGQTGYQQGMLDLQRLKQQAEQGQADRTFDYNEFLREQKDPYQKLTFMGDLSKYIPAAALSPAAVQQSAYAPGGTSDAFNTFFQALASLGTLVPGTNTTTKAEGGLISGIASLGNDD